MPDISSEREDVQGNIELAYRFPHAQHLFLDVRAASPGRALLAALIPTVTTAAPWPDGRKPQSALNLSVNYPALEALGVTPKVRATFPEAFVQGMRQRAQILGDDEHTWDPFWRERRVQVWLAIHAANPEALAQRKAQVEALVQRSDGGVALHAYQDVCTELREKDLRVEHFGFADGASNPSIDLSRRDALDASSERPLARGEILLGYPDEFGDTASAPDPQIARNGTFVVYRKMRQHVASFRIYVAAMASKSRLAENVVAAKMVGRYADGTPLAPPGFKDNNDFDFADDPGGGHCPLGSHIRRANPRNGRQFPKLAARHRMIRRGLPYGPRLPEGAEDDRADRGLVFIALNASLERQYEFVQQRWMSDGADNRQGSDRDPIIGAHGENAKMIIQGDALSRQLPFLCTKLPRFIDSLGGEYFFMPGINGLRALANDQFSADSPTGKLTLVE